jgi:gamma-glutamyltranspeptidase/glutathione hydrolase
MLLAGGNAVDAAIAAAAVLAVVEPFSTGLGGDAFALVYQANGEVLALNASGRAPATWSLDEARRRGYAPDGPQTALPMRGALTVSTPGTVDGWATLLARCGRMALADVLAPAIAYAEQGFPVSPIIAAAWAEMVPVLQAGFGGEAFLVAGRAPRTGEMFRQPEMAATLRAIAEGGPQAFYHGPIAETIAAAVQGCGGYLSTADLAAHTSSWETPIEVEYRGVRMLECPPNGHGLVALLALNTLRNDDMAALGFGSAAALHLQIEALRAAFADGLYYVADPAFNPAPLEALLSPAYGRARRAGISSHASTHVHGNPISGDTVYLTAADAEGNAVSFINSVFYGFGSGIVAPGTGVMLQNRGALFELDPAHPNALAPRKRPYHTIIPAMALDAATGRLRASFGVMGGFMQPQGHVQVLQNMLDFAMDPQQALDAPRFCVSEGRGTVLVEAGIDPDVVRTLTSLGHPVAYADPGSFGGGQIIAVDPDSGAYIAGSDPRKDGCAVGF